MRVFFRALDSEKMLDNNIVSTHRCTLLKSKRSRKKYKEKDMKLKPLADNIVIKPKEKEEKTESGIFLPDSTGESKPESGEVVAVGPGKRDEKGERIKPEVKKGDEVIFTKYGPNEIKVDDVEYLIAREDDILAIVEK